MSPTKKKKTAIPQLQTNFEEGFRSMISPIEEIDEVSPVLNAVNPFSDRESKDNNNNHLHSSSLPANILFNSYISKTEDDTPVVNNILTVPDINMDTNQSPVTPNELFYGKTRGHSRRLPDYGNDSDFDYARNFSFGAGSASNDHSHEHTHSNGDSHEHAHGNDDSHEHDHSHEHAHSHDDSHEHDHSHEHGHSHEHEHDHSHNHAHDRDEHDHSHNHAHDRGEHDETYSHEHTHNHNYSHGHDQYDSQKYDASTQHSHSHNDHGHSHSSNHNDTTHEKESCHSHGHPHSHQNLSDTCTHHEEETGSQNPLNNLISYLFPFLNDSSDDDHRLKMPLNSIWSFITQLYQSKETKSIFRFLVLNFTFMFVQMVYSFRSKSLGLFSDSLHMLLDCSSLAIGLFAKLISKNITSIFYDVRETDTACNSHSHGNSHSHDDHSSQSHLHSHSEDHSTSLDTAQQSRSNVLSSAIFTKYPFGLARIETLAAFVNGILLISIVQDIFFQSIDRILNPVPLKNINELLVVSILGLVVNLVGIFAFNHGEDEDEGSGHGHSHSLKGLFGGGDKKKDDHQHSHDGNVACAYDQDDPYLQKLTHLSDDESFGSNSSNENDHGIFLHILADTLGSFGVIVSTILLKFFPTFKVLDPVSSLFIIILILASSIPLIKNSFMNLLLILNQKEKFLARYSNSEALIKDLLNDLYETPGVLNINKIKVWKDERGGGGGGHSHSHSHSHSHNDESEAHHKRTGLIGYVHIQYADGENSTIIKKRCEKIIFEQYKMDLFIQLENEAWGNL